MAELELELARAQEDLKRNETAYEEAKAAKLATERATTSGITDMAKDILATVEARIRAADGPTCCVSSGTDEVHDRLCLSN